MQSRFTSYNILRACVIVFLCFRSLVGVFTADNARRRLANLSGSTSDGLEKFIVKKFYKVDLSHKPTLGLVSRLLDIASYVVVVKSGMFVIRFSLDIIRKFMCMMGFHGLLLCRCINENCKLCRYVELGRFTATYLYRKQIY